MATNESCTLNEAREVLGVSEKTMRNYCKSNKIPFFKERNIRGVLEYRFRRADLLFFLQQRSTGKSSGKLLESLPEEQPIDNALTSNADQMLPNKKTGKNEKKDGRDMENFSAVDAGILHQYSQDNTCHAALLTQLKQENAFLKELLLEKEKQLTAKDSQLERCVEKISSLSDTLALITRESLTKEFS